MRIIGARAALTILPAIFGLASLTLPAMAADNGKLSAAEFNAIASAPMTPADHVALAKHYRAWAAEDEAEAKMFEAFAVGYMEGVPQASPTQARSMAMAARHYAEHARDSAEALIYLAEVHEGFAEFVGSK